MSLKKNDCLAPKHSSLNLLILLSLATILASFTIQTTEAAPGFNDRRIYPNWDRRFDHRIRLAKKSFQDEGIPQPLTRALTSDEADADAVERAIQMLLQSYGTKNNLAKRDYIRLL